MSLAPTDVRAFYDASLLGLRLLDARLPEPRRFGPNADAQWANFRGHLTARDRVDLLLRDGDAEHLGAFSARQVFALEAVAEDETFGRDWVSLDDGDAERALRSVISNAAPTGAEDLVQRVAEIWHLAPAPVDLGPVTPTTRLLLAGAGAVVAAVRAFASRTELAFGTQVGVIATHPGERHLAALAAAALGSRAPELFGAAEEARRAGPWDRVVVCEDATPEAAAAARSNAT